MYIVQYRYVRAEEQVRVRKINAVITFYRTMVELEEPEQVLKKPKKKGSSLDLLWNLVNAKKNAQAVDASSKILTHVSRNPAEVTYTLKRLLRGLASTNALTRQNSFVCLTELLRQQSASLLPGPAEVLAEAQETLKVVGGSKSEEGNLLLGQMLACLALLRAGRLNSSSLRLEVLELVLANGAKRNYLQFLAVSTVVDYYLDEELEGVLARVAKSLPVKLAEASLDSLYLILAIFDKKKESLSEEFCKSSFGVKSLWKKSALDLLSKALLGSCLPYAAVEKHPVMKSLVAVVETSGVTAKFWSRLVSEMTGTAYKGLIAMLFLR